MRNLIRYIGIHDIKILLISLAIFGPNVSQAIDLGVKGVLYPIEEVDMRLAFIASAHQVDWKAVRKEMEENSTVEAYVERLPTFSLPPANEDRIRWVDLTIEVQEDVENLVLKDGEYVREVMIPAGTKVNPFTKVRPITRRIYFNGESADQIEFVRMALERYPGRITPIATGGDPQKLAKDIGQVIFYAKEWEVARFNITHTPSVIGPGAGEHRYELAVVELGLPYEEKNLDWAMKEMP